MVQAGKKDKAQLITLEAEMREMALANQNLQAQLEEMPPVSIGVPARAETSGSLEEELRRAIKSQNFFLSEGIDYAVEDSGEEKEDEKAKEENKVDPAIVTPEGGGAVHAYYNPITRGKPLSAAQRLVSVPRTPPGSQTSFEGDADLSSAKWSRYGVHVPQTP